MEDYTLAEIRSKFFWQETPVKLLSYARDLSKQEGDFNRYISYLLLDIGMETLLKTYLCLDSDISKAKISFRKRIEYINRDSFHQLVIGARKAAGDRLDADILERVKYLHSIRNRVYHQRDDVPISEDHFKEYYSLAKTLLSELLNIGIE